MTQRCVPFVSLSAVLSGTPEQLRSLVRDAENGLFSRFIYYRLNSGLEWKNVFANPTGESLNQTFEDLGAIFAEFHEQLEQAPALRFCLKEAHVTVYRPNLLANERYIE